MSYTHTLVSLKIAISKLRRTPKNDKDRHSYSEIVRTLYPDLNEWDFGRVRAAIYHIAERGYRPKGNKLRSLLGLCNYENIEVCPVHNVVHRVTCPDLAIKPPPKKKKPRPDYRLRPVQVRCTREQYEQILELSTVERAKILLKTSDSKKGD